MREVSKRTARCTGLTHTHALTAGCSRTSCPRPGQWRSRQSSTLQRRGGAGKTGSGWREAGVGGPHTYPPVSQPSARCMQAQRRPVTPLPPSCCHPPSHQARCPARHRRTCRPPPPPPPHTHTHPHYHPPTWEVLGVHGRHRLLQHLGLGAHLVEHGALQAGRQGRGGRAEEVGQQGRLLGPRRTGSASSTGA